MRALVARRPGLVVLGALAVPYFVTTIVASSRRHLWNDELFTYYFARLPSLTDVWHQLKTGVEQTPPLFYVVTRASLWAFGNTNVAIRLPEIVGVFVACCAVYKVVERRTSVSGGATAALVVLSSAALPFGYEARPYGLVLGLAAVALLLWQVRADTGSAWASAGVGVTLICAVSMHYYAVLLVLPIGAAEAIRSAERRRLDLGVVAALASPLVSLLAYAPLIRGADRYAGKFWTTFGWSSALRFYGWLLRSPAVPPSIETWSLVALVGVSVVVLLSLAARGRAVAKAELAAAIGFLFLPLVAVTVAKTKTGAFTERYTLAAVLGLALLVPLGLDRLPRGRGAVQAIVLLGLAAFFVRACIYDVRDVDADRSIQRETIAFLGRTDPGLPVVVAHPHDYLELQRYAPPPVRARLRYVSSRRLSLRYLGTTSTEDGLIVMSRFTRLDLRPYEQFVSAHRPFLVFVNPGAGPRLWLVRALRADGRRLQPVAKDQGRVLYLVR